MAGNIKGWKLSSEMAEMAGTVLFWSVLSDQEASALGTNWRLVPNIEKGSISGTPRGGWMPKPQATLAVSAQSRFRNQNWYIPRTNQCGFAIHSIGDSGEKP